MHPAEAHTIFEDTLKRSRQGAIDWRIKETKSTPDAVDFEAPARDGAHGVEIGSVHVEEHGTVYEFRIVDDAGQPLYDFALSHHTAAPGDLRTYEEFVELFTLAKHHALSRSGRTR
jgi:hypothetical protein